MCTGYVKSTTEPGYMVAKRVPSSRCLPNFNTFSQRLHQLLLISETNGTSTEAFQKQYDTMDFSTRNVNPRCIEGTVSLKHSSMRLSLAPCHLSADTSSAFFSVRDLFCLKTTCCLLQSPQRRCHGLHDSSLLQNYSRKLLFLCLVSIHLIQ